MITQQQQDVTLQIFQQNLGALKRRLAQTNGEASQLTTDAMSQTMESIMGITTLIFNQMAAKDRRIVELKAELEKVYNAHPELKVSAEAEKKKKLEAQKKPAKKV